jgi:16S rRNA (uracil1498-N3)-methyltransferase
LATIMRRRFLVDSFENGRAELRGSDARHLGRVLRAHPGQLYELSDGRSVWLAKVAQVERDRLEFTLVEPVAASQVSLEVSLLISIVRFAHFEWAIEKATELGVAAIQPVAASRTERGLIDAAAKRHTRWEKIAREAAQQSRRLAPPRLLPPLRAGEAFRQAASQRRLLLSERPGAPPLEKFRPAAPLSSLALAFGPEGGWTDAELALAGQAGFQEASLGPLILRAETAVVAALAVVLCSWIAG